VQKTPDASESANGRTQKGEVAEQVDVIQQRVCEPLSSGRMLLPRPAHDFFEVG